ncbi:MAG: polymer-forming cytoskeletal protein [Pseudomonadota bacterium]
MFSKSKITDTSKGDATPAPAPTGGPAAAPPAAKPQANAPAPAAPPKAKPPASILSEDLTITGNLETTGDIEVKGTIKGDIRAHLLTVGEGATVEGEVVADDVVVNGRVVGRVRGLKVRLTSQAKVDGDIIHKTIAIESGAQFEGSVNREEDPLKAAAKKPIPTAAAAPQTQAKPQG